MTSYEWASIILSIVAIILIPAVVIMIRGAIKWTRTEVKLAELVTDIRDLVGEVRSEREATDKRLRYIEEWFMSGRRRGAR